MRAEGMRQRSATPRSMLRATLASLRLWDWRKADRESNILVVIPKSTAGHTRDTCLLEQAECIFPRLEFAPIVYCSLVIQPNFIEQIILSIKLVQLKLQVLAPQVIEALDLLLYLRVLIEPLDVCCKAQLPLRR